MAETTTATSWPASTSAFTFFAAETILAVSATDVPPNFITMRAIGRYLLPVGLCRIARRPSTLYARGGAYIHEPPELTQAAQGMNTGSTIEHDEIERFD